jgi:hypothetical protein
MWGPEFWPKEPRGHACSSRPRTDGIAILPIVEHAWSCSAERFEQP